MAKKCMFFSPTGSTEIITRRVCAGIGGDFEFKDITPAAALPESEVFGPDDLLVVGIPVFGGRVPISATEKLLRLKGTGTPAVPIAVFGNRDFDDALVELADTLTAGGFVPIAAGAFVAEHSVARVYGSGRPGAADLAAVDDFADRVRQKLAAGDFGAPQIPGNRPYRAHMSLPVKPYAGRSCTSCGICAARCPTGAIPTDLPKFTDKKLCVTCMACVSVCPQKARTLGSLGNFAARAALKKVCSSHKLPQVFV